MPPSSSTRKGSKTCQGISEGDYIRQGENHEEWLRKEEWDTSALIWSSWYSVGCSKGNGSNKNSHNGAVFSGALQLFFGFLMNTEAEYRALADTTSELLWLRWLLKDLGVSTSSATPLYCDNQSAIHIAHNDVFHERTKHIEIDCHFIRYHLVHGALKLFSVSSKDQLADIFTKSLPKRRTRDLVDNLKLVSHPP
ncbi:Retrovirus-related Pol polyprotein from transposon RE2 [Vitis vinifera]|uniref:Retrovirus-related Pol polyprotein from transposon RE2 n=1 Tax=Vitis vinifera TaxID=29760 RepID=A0A438JFZ4_VITVI|nr:Retrovirus-related Pol polyprotein from transposon RE2 [Vitis vinifera]